MTKNYPDDALSDLDHLGRWRLNVHVGKARFAELLGADPKSAGRAVDFSSEDTLIPHPVYAGQGWIAIVNRGARTSSTAIELLRHAHEAAQRRANRRRAESTAGSDETDNS